MKYQCCALSLLCLVSVYLPASAQDWPQFRGPDGDGRAAAKNLPIKWSKTENVAWHVKIPGKGWSSPILVEGKLYLTTAVLKSGQENDPKADRTLRALCLDAKTGQSIWDVPVFEQDGKSAPDTIHQKNSHASPTPIIHEKRLYVHFGHQGTACLDLAGKRLWENRKLRYEPRHGGGSSPIIVDDKLVFSCDGTVEQFVAALRLRDGEVAWKFKRNSTARSKFAFATPACITVNGKKQIITPGANVVNALDPAKGEEIWRVNYEGYSIVPKPVFGNGLVYVSTSFDTPEVLAIDPTGKGDITDTHVKWIVNERPPMTPSMILDGDLLFWVSDNGVASCLDAKTGTIHWSERCGKGCSASPVLSEGKIYIQDENGTCTIVKAAKTFEKIAENSLDGERTLASHAVTDGAIFLRTETGLYRIGK